VTQERARVALGVIRLINGILALLLPSVLADRLARGGERSSASTYVFRLFGIRTIFLGLDLLTANEPRRREALRRAPIIHASDAAAAFLAGVSRQLPFGAAVAASGISCLNLVLALAASPRDPNRSAGAPSGPSRVR
jgi:uncharacterized protein YjeT (DUF2065 family)